jgi:hypothetical protein
MKRLIVVLLLLMMMVGLSVAQDSLHAKPMYLHTGKIGLGLDGITGSPNLLMKYFVNNQLAVQIIVGVDVDQPGGDAAQGQTKRTGVDIRGGVGILFHLTQEQLSPYLGVEALFQQSRTAGFFTTVPDPKNSVIAGGIFGAEFFLNERFTVGVKQNLGVAIGLKRDAPKEETSLRFSTSTLMTGRYYFN